MTTPNRISRRSALTLGLTLATTSCATDHEPAPPADPPVGPHGTYQAGVAAPRTPLPQAYVAVLDADPTLLARQLRTVSAIVTEDAESRRPTTAVTVTTGVGPRIALPLGVDVELPEFPREEMADHQRGGDVLVQVTARQPTDGATLLSRVVAALGGPPAVRWSQTGFATDNATNLLGFSDGLRVPAADELDDAVWLRSPPLARGGTIAVVRRLRIDVPRFAVLPPAERERVIGRRATGEPLSGGGRGEPVDLSAKNPDGTYVIPADAHVRRSHPGPIGAKLMLRRSYNYDNGPADQGLMFISYQQQLRTFVETLRRMSERDRLLEFTTTTATGAFLILPGFTPEMPLGSTVFTP